MKLLCLGLIAAGTCFCLQSDQSVDRRVEQPKGYHIIARPARTGETPPDVKQEKADEDRRRNNGRNDTDINNQTPPTRQPDLKPKGVTP